MFLRLLLCFAVVSTVAAQDSAPVDFDRHVRPILSDKCFPCHGPDEKSRQAKLRLDVKDEALSQSRKTIAIIPGDASKSELVRRVRAIDDDRMPPADSKLALSATEKETLERWVEQGAVWAQHWAFRKPVRPNLPATKFASRAKNSIDRFVFSRLEREGLEPSEGARTERLLRRVTLELTGLPPTPDEIDAFVADRRAGAYERLVDRLLASPRFGERMVWDWLDASRYADSNGYQGDSERTMWPWRDWAIEAFNANLPFDRFTIEQLAGDLLPDAGPEQRVATGFHRNHMINGEGGRIAEENRIEYVFDQTETTATIWLGLTVGCARCHDHKFDPITQREYYQLFAFFNNTPVNGGGRSGQQSPVISYEDDAAKRRRLTIESRLDAAVVVAIERERSWGGDKSPANTLPEDLRKTLANSPKDRTPDVLDRLAKHFDKTLPDYAKDIRAVKAIRDEIDRHRRGLPKVMVLEERPERRDTFILERGLYNKRGEKVSANIPAALPPLAKREKIDRLALAEWLMEPEHPLVARVAINRIWQGIFGAGFVKTTADFGSQGEKPTHPLLLDWLAVEFLESGWDVKHIVRLILTSATYRQTSKMRPESLERDPENRYLSHAPRFRWPSNMLRDQALAASGLLVQKIGGPSVNPYQPPGIWEEATFGKKKFSQDHGEKLYRRSLYTFWRRIVRPTMFFDVASRQTCTVSRQLTNTPLHALITLNETTYVEAARAFAQSVLRNSSDDRECLTLMFRRLVSRRPDSDEIAILEHRLKTLRRDFAVDVDGANALLQVGESPRDENLRATEHAAWTVIALSLFNMDETLSRE